MADELVYTSMPRGLKPGSRGFCVVASTANLSPRTLSVLESLSAYRHLQTPVGGPHPGNPVAWSHFLLPGEGTSILSRVADSGLDYSGRTNKLAHHIVLDHAQRSPHGPAAMLAAASNLMTSWSGDPRILPPRNLQPGRSLSGPCSLWQSVAGDAGWAGELARNSFNQPRTIVISADDNALGLINEAMSLVPPQHRWRIGFTTFDNGLPQDVRCHWRFVIAGSAEHVQIQKNPPPGLIDLTATLGPAPESNEAKMARSGDRSSVAATVSQVAASPPGMARPATGHSSSDRSVSQKVAAFQAQTGQAADDLVLAPLMPQRLPPAAPGSVPVRPKASSNSASTKEPRGIGFVLTLVALTGCLFLVLAGGGVWFAMQRLTSQEPANTMTIDRIVEQQEATKPKVIEPIKIEQPAEDETGPIEVEMKQDVAFNSEEAPDTTEEENATVVVESNATSVPEPESNTSTVPPKVEIPVIKVELVRIDDFVVPTSNPIAVERYRSLEKTADKSSFEFIDELKKEGNQLVRSGKENESKKDGLSVDIKPAIFKIQSNQLAQPTDDPESSTYLLWKEKEVTYFILPSASILEISIDSSTTVSSDLKQLVELASGSAPLKLTAPLQSLGLSDLVWEQRKNVRNPKNSDWDNGKSQLEWKHQTKELEKDISILLVVQPTVDVSAKPPLIRGGLSGQISLDGGKLPESSFINAFNRCLDIANGPNGLRGKQIEVSLYGTFSAGATKTFLNKNGNQAVCDFSMNGKKLVATCVFSLNKTPNWIINKPKPKPESGE